MTAYNIYVKRKEKELKDKIEELKTSTSTEKKDDRIKYLEMSLGKLRRETQE